jgi:hypothetical protein
MGQHLDVDAYRFENNCEIIVFGDDPQVLPRGV